MLGSTIDGKYQVVRLLGQGGMGAVYEALHVGTGRRVALKVILGEITLSQDAIARFQREARAAGVIESQHIVQVFDVGVDRQQGVPFMVMEYLVGEDLQKLCEKLGALSPDLALRVVAQACMGLQKAHEAGVVHRDIKPANLFLTHREDGDIVVRLLDFGIAKVKLDQLSAGTDQGLTRTGSMLGSPLYMSPEQAMGLKTVDHRTDVWSLGAVMYEALTGQTPHQGADTLGQLIMAICSAPPKPLQQAAPWIPAEVAEIVHRALRLNAAERYQSAAEMRDAIRKLLPHGTALTESHLVPLSEDVKRSTAPVYQIITDMGAPGAPLPMAQVSAITVNNAAATGNPFTSTASKPPPRSSSKAPLFMGLGAVAAIGAGGLWYATQSHNIDGPVAAEPSVSAPLITAQAAPSAPPAAVAIAPSAAPAEVAAPSDAVPSASAAVAKPPEAPAAAARAGTKRNGAAVATPAPAAAAKTPAAKPGGLTVDKKFE